MQKFLTISAEMFTLIHSSLAMGFPFFHAYFISVARIRGHSRPLIIPRLSDRCQRRHQRPSAAAVAGVIAEMAFTSVQCARCCVSEL